MESPVRVIFKHSGIACGQCNAVAKACVDLYSNQFPVIAICPYCGEGNEWKYPPNTQKTISDKSWILKTLNTDSTTLTELTHLASRLEEKAREFSAEVYEVEAAINKAITAMKESLSERLCSTVDFVGGFSGAAYERWMQQPFLVMPLRTGKVAVDSFARMILSPSWHTLKLGITILETFGYRIDITCPSILRQFPLPKKILSAAMLPKSPDITAYGEKVAGPGIDELSIDIHGDCIACDVDHYDDHPSYVISNYTRFFSHFGKYGICAMQPKPMKIATPGERFMEAGLYGHQLVWMSRLFETSRAFCCGGELDEFIEMLKIFSSVTGNSVLLLTERKSGVAGKGMVVVADSIDACRLPHSAYIDFPLIAIDYETWNMENSGFILRSKSAVVGYAKNPLLDLLTANAMHPLAMSITQNLAMPDDFKPDELSGHTASMLMQLTLECE